MRSGSVLGSGCLATASARTYRRDSGHPGAVGCYGCHRVHDLAGRSGERPARS